MKRRLALWGGAGFVLLLLSVVVSLSLGSANLPLSHVWGIILHQLPFLEDVIETNWAASSEQIILKVRLPRVFLAILVGACLSLAGAGFQGVLRNPLADPYTLGVASGSAVGAAFLILFGFHTILFGTWTIPLVAFVTGLISLLVVLRLANVQGKYKLETIILSGVVVSAFLGAIVSFMVSMSDQVVNEIVFWLMGSLALRGWSFTFVLMPYLAIGIVVLLSYGRTLNLFALGERQAAHLGVNIKRTRLVVLIVSTLITAAAVSIVGTIGFVGLVVPHLVRLIVGPDYRLLLPLTVIFGAIYVLWADTIARTLLSPTEIPLGVVTAVLGAPFFAYLLRRNKQMSGGN
ncbi:FecCD family ABC transporter permease [Cytobacillus solani]|uniref:Iron ABC transporter n=1 Tax=Cytobacillus solani TaxID=1637975 RepID=A0A0Q3VFG4_9BACI|nr:iron ABC transporter permease [Cytobacillus solani]KOP71264.1 iron ABC transporter [Bacillus sp. FJAT-21945]KQL17794.1 iron ABC transporter [Cytobacillus solani]USK55604.1 iron ABC transporter permease [Cytobacillus solani]